MFHPVIAVLGASIFIFLLSLQTLDPGRLAADPDVRADRIAFAVTGAGSALVGPAQARGLKVAIVLHVHLRIVRRRRTLFRARRADHRGRCDERKAYEKPYENALSAAHGAKISHSSGVLPRRPERARELVGRGKAAMEASWTKRGKARLACGTQAAADPAHAWR
jgi:hypothetical protein